MVHVPAPQYVRQWPSEHPRLQSPEGGQVSSQLPEEQSIVQGPALHADTQFPELQLHVFPGHCRAVRGVPVPGSATTGPPFGPPLPPGLLEPPHPAIRMREKPKPATNLFMTKLLPGKQAGTAHSHYRLDDPSRARNRSQPVVTRHALRSPITKTTASTTYATA
jgi:hypothetical protein